MFAFFLQSATTWSDYASQGAVFSLVVVLLMFILKVLPTWKEIRLAELSVRTKEAESIGSLGNSLNQLGSVMNNIAIEQRKSTENVLILQRVSASESRNLSHAVDELLERMAKLEESLDDNLDCEEKRKTAKP